MRALGLIAFSIATGAALGMVTAVVTVPFVAEGGPVLGALTGLIVSPLVVLCLRRKDAALALPAIFIATAAVTMLALDTRLPFFVMSLSTGTFCVSTVLVGLLLPNRPAHPASETSNCSNCGYDLTGNDSGRCPECGTVIASSETLLGERPAQSSRRRNAVAVFALAVVVLIFGAVGRWQAARMKPADTVQGLIEQLGNPEALVHEPAIDELVKRGRAPLLQALEHANPTVRAHAVKGLLRLQDPATVPDLIRALDDSDPWARMWAARGLGYIGDEAAICPLLQKRDDSVAFVRESVDLALRDLGVDLQSDPAEYGCNTLDDSNVP